MLIQNTYGHGMTKFTTDGKPMDVVLGTQARGFFNLGVEFEYLKHYDESITAYSEALKLCKV